MRKIKFIIPVILLCLSMSACGGNKTEKDNDVKTTKNDKEKAESKVDIDINLLKKQFDMPKKGDTIATINVKDFGAIKIKFFKDVAPKAVENFVTHAKEGYYNGLSFHRIVQDFVIQGGDPKGDGTGGESIWGKPFEDEFPDVKNPTPFPYNGALAMANAGANTNGSQFFIVNSVYKKDTEQKMRDGGFPAEMIELYQQHGGTPHLFHKHTVFGQVFEGMDVVGKIMQSQNGGSSKVIIDNIEISEY